MEKARKTEARGAFGLETPDGHKEMIDEPMVKQVGAIDHMGASNLSLLHFRPYR